MTPAAPARSFVGAAFLVLALSVPAALSSVILFRDLPAASFDGDESWYLHFGRFFDLYFLEGDLSSAEWRGPWAYDQPSLGKFVYGFATWVTGTSDERPRRPWDFEVGEETNRLQGRAPGKRALLVGRQAAAGFGVAAVLAAAACGVLAGGAACGFLAGLLLSLNPLFVERSRHATTDSMLAFFLLASLALSLASVRALREDRLGRGLALAFFQGLAVFGAVGTKLNGALAGIVFAAALVWGLASRLLEGRLDSRSVFAAAASLALAAALSLVLFAAANPGVLADPAEAAVAFVETRSRTLEGQAKSTDYPLEEGERWERLVSATLTGDRSRHNFVVLGRVAGVPVDAVLAGLGALFFIAADLFLRPARDPRRGLGVPVVFFAAIVFGVTAPFLAVNWSRYFLPPVLGVTLLVAGGGGAFTSFVLARRASRGQSDAAAS